MVWLWVLLQVATASEACPTPLSVTAGVDDVQPAVVALSDGIGSGSGFFIQPNGLLLTAAHVLHGPSTTVHIGGVAVEGEVVRSSTELDLALVQVSGMATPCLELVDPPAVGGEVWGLGFPGGHELGQSVSKGVTSGIKTVKGATLLQTDANISPGHSGGPLVDAQGRAVGVISWKIVKAGFEGMSFAVPRSVVEAWQATPVEGKGVPVGTAQRPEQERLSLVTEPLGVSGPAGAVDVLEFATLVSQDDVVAEIERRRRRKSVAWGFTAAGLTALVPTVGGLGAMATREPYEDAFTIGATAASVGGLTSCILLGIGAKQHKKARTRYADFYSDRGMQTLIDTYNTAE